jgi:carbonic anhydrase/acetyltransferase-like protein (isoleucine patch superfamily)
MGRNSGRFIHLFGRTIDNLTGYFIGEGAVLGAGCVIGEECAVGTGVG